MICDHIRDIEEFREFYKNRPMPNQYDWDFLVNNPNLFCFYDEDNGEFKGYITVQREEVDKKNVLTLSGASIRKNLANIIDAIIMVCNAFDDDMYSVTKIKPAKLCLLKAGFKRMKDNIYVRYKNGK